MCARRENHAAPVVVYVGRVGSDVSELAKSDMTLLKPSRDLPGWCLYDGADLKAWWPVTVPLREIVAFQIAYCAGVVNSHE